MKHTGNTFDFLRTKQSSQVCIYFFGFILSIFFLFSFVSFYFIIFFPFFFVSFNYFFSLFFRFVLLLFLSLLSYFINHPLILYIFLRTLVTDADASFSVVGNLMYFDIKGQLYLSQDFLCFHSADKQVISSLVVSLRRLKEISHHEMDAVQIATEKNKASFFFFFCFFKKTKHQISLIFLS